MNVVGGIRRGRGARKGRKPRRASKVKPRRNPDAIGRLRQARNSLRGAAAGSDQGDTLEKDTQQEAVAVLPRKGIIDVVA